MGNHLVNPAYRAEQKAWEEANLVPLDRDPAQLQLPGFDPEIPATRSKALVGAWRKGRAAALEGRSLADCPYVDKRAGRYGHIVTFSRAFRKWWRDGFESVGLFPSVTNQGVD